MQVLMCGRGKRRGPEEQPAVLFSFTSASTATAEVLSTSLKFPSPSAKSVFRTNKTTKMAITLNGIYRLLNYIYSLVFLSVQYVLEQVQYFLNGPVNYSEQVIENKVVIVTGGNAGLGKQAALEFAKRRATVVIACRNLAEGKRAQVDIVKRAHLTNAEQVDVMHLDLADLTSVRKFAEVVSKKYPEVSVLVNNAGVMGKFFEEGGTVTKKTKDQFEMHMGVNHLGHFLLTELLTPVLKAGAPSRVINLSSSMLLFSYLDPERFMNMDTHYHNVAYGNSKLCNALHARVLADKLKDSGITTYSVCPGLVRTNLQTNLPVVEQIFTAVLGLVAGRSLDQAVETVVYCALAKSLAAESGKFYRSCVQNNYINDLLDRETVAGQQIWFYSEKLVGLTIKK